MKLCELADHHLVSNKRFVTVYITANEEDAQELADIYPDFTEFNGHLIGTYYSDRRMESIFAPSICNLMVEEIYAVDRNVFVVNVY